MTSTALDRWRTSGLGRLAELEGVHATLTGPGPGRRWGTTQLNRSLFVALVAQFQSYCRDLHDAAARVHVDAAIAGQKQTLHLLIRQGRKLETHNPRRSTLGHDFGRLGFSLIEDLKATGPATVEQLDLLDLLVDYRNAIGHGDEVRIAALEASGRVKATKKSYLQHRRSLDALAGTIDATVAAGLARVLRNDHTLVKEEVMSDDLKVGDVVAFLWGVSEVRGTVAEVYGQKGHRQVVIALDPDTTGYVVDEPTTVSLPIEDVRRAVAA